MGRIPQPPLAAPPVSRCEPMNRRAGPSLPMPARFLSKCERNTIDSGRQRKSASHLRMNAGPYRPPSQAETRLHICMASDHTPKARANPVRKKHRRARCRVCHHRDGASERSPATFAPQSPSKPSPSNASRQKYARDKAPPDALLLPLTRKASPPAREKARRRVGRAL